MVKPSITLSESFWLNKCNVDVWQLLWQQKNVWKKVDAKRIMIKKKKKKKGAYATDKQTSKVNSRKIILRPVIFQNKFYLFCFYSYITYKMVSCRFWNHGWPVIKFFFLRVSNGQKDVLLIDLNISPWYCHHGTASYQWESFSIRKSPVKAVVI